MSASTWVFVALETSGPDPAAHSILEIAAVAIEVETFKELETVSLLILPEKPFKVAEGWRIPDMDNLRWVAAEPEETQLIVFDQFLKHHASVTRKLKKSGNEVKNARIAGHGAAKFDYPHLLRWFRRFNKPFPADPYCMDTAQLLAFLDPELAGTEGYEALSVEALCRRMNATYPKRDDLFGASAAMAKARASARCAIEFWDSERRD